ncbi:MAG: ABC transporter permease, partial [Deltaproteobacteria bacterium]
FGVYISSVLETMGFMDVIASLLKSIIFGLIIGAVATLHGLRVGRSITQIPQETTKAVITSLFLVFIVDGIITAVFFM